MADPAADPAAEDQSDNHDSGGRGEGERHVVDAREEQRQFHCVIVDESHYLKNRDAARTKCLAPVLRGARRVVLLSGTPALARPSELWAQVAPLRPVTHESTGSRLYSYVPTWTGHRC
mgnify:CR=1 FL=1